VLADIFGWPLEIALGLGGAGFYFYSVYDAFQSAQRLRRGEDLRLEDERLKLFLQRRMNLFGALLIGVGALAMLDFWIPNLLHRVWPVLLIIAGAYLVGSYYRGGRAPQAKAVYQTPPPSAVSSSLDPGARDLASAQRRERYSRTDISLSGHNPRHGQTKVCSTLPPAILILSERMSGRQASP